MEKPLDLTDKLRIVKACYQRAIKYSTDKNPASELLKHAMAKIEDAVKALRAASEVATPSEADKIVALTAYRTLMEESLPAQWQVPNGLTAKELGTWVELRSKAWELLLKALRLDKGRLSEGVPKWARCPICDSRLAPLIEQKAETEAGRLTVRYEVRMVVCEKGHRLPVEDLPAGMRLAVRDCVDAMAELTRRRLKEALAHLEELQKNPAIVNKWVVEWQPKFTLLVSATSKEMAKDEAARELGPEVEELGRDMFALGWLPDEAIVRPATEEDVRELPSDEGDEG